MHYCEHVYQRLVSLSRREAVEFPPETLPSPFTRAAVLLLLWPTRDGRIELVLTRRSTHLSSHGGHIAFPGGRREEHDSDLSLTALREAQEELGLEPERVTIMGRLDDIWSFQGYHIVPFVGWLPERPPLRPEPGEVEEVIITDLEHLSGCATTFTPQGYEMPETPRYTQAYHWEHCYVWGITAEILLEFQLWVDDQPSNRGSLRLQMLQREYSS